MFAVSMKTMCSSVEVFVVVALIVATSGADDWEHVMHDHQLFTDDYSEVGNQQWLVHIIEHPKTYFEAKKYCHGLCSGCGLMDSSWLQNYRQAIRPYITSRRYWLGFPRNRGLKTWLCPALKGRRPEDEEGQDDLPYLEHCDSEMSFFCILPKKNQKCQRSLTVRDAANYHTMSTGCGAWADGNTALLDFHSLQEYRCARLYAALSPKWWTSSGLRHTGRLESYLGPPNDGCVAAEHSIRGNLIFGRTDCQDELPYICVQSMSENGPTAIAPSGAQVQRPERVKCYYFAGDAVGTYCHVLDPDGAIDAVEAEEQCRMLDMSLINVQLIDPHRLCLLIDVFGIGNSKLWIASQPKDIFASFHTGECDLIVGNVTVAKNGSSICSNCSARVVCAGLFYQRSLNCVTIMERSSMDYCYANVGKNAFQSEGQCMRNSLALLDTTTMLDPAVQKALYPVIDFNHLEFWLDLNDEDISNLSAVVAFPSRTPATRERRCSSVWLGRDIPWIFERKCDHKLPIICVKSHPAMPPASRSQDRHGYHRLETLRFFFPPDNDGYHLEEGLAYCNSRNMSLLNGNALNYLHDFFNAGEQELPISLIWVKDSNNKSSPNCTAAETPRFTKRTNENCTNIHPYVCRGQLTKKVETPCFRCQNCSQPYSFCPSDGYAYGSYSANYSTSSTICRASYDFLLPNDLEYTDYLQMFLSVGAGRSEIIEVWLDSSNGGDDEGCVSLYYRDNQVFWRALDCSTLLRFVCIRVDGESTRTAMIPPSEARPTTAVGRLTTDSPGTTPCPAEETQNFQWPTTKQNEYASIPCHDSAAGPSVGMVRRRCSSFGEWEDFIDTSRCVSKKVEKMLENTETLNDTRKIGRALMQVSEEVSAGGDLLKLANGVSNALDKLDTLIANLSDAEKRNRSEDLAKETVAVAQNVMEKKSAWHGLPQESRLKAATEYMGTVEESVKKMLKYSLGGTSFDLSQGDVTVEVRKSDKEALSKEFSLPAKKTGTSVSLPPNFVQSEAVVSVLYAEYPSLGALLNKKQQTDDQSDTSKVGTPVVTATVLLNQTSQSSILGNVTLRFKNMVENSRDMDQKCVFLIVDNTTSQWNDSGCSVVSSTDSEITCTCDHLTNFAVLMSAKSEETSTALEWITDIGCAISIVCLVLCILVFTVYRQLWGIRNTIHRNLCISLLLAEIVFLFALDRGEKSAALCTAITCILHFLFLSAFSWMALEGCHIILLLWKVFNPKRDYYERYYLAGYGIPLVIVSVTVGIGYDAYQNSTSHYCWIPRERNLRLSFIIPVVLVVLLNIGALCLVLWKMSRLKQAADKSTAEKIRNWVRGTIILLPLLGVTWLVGLALWRDTVGVMAYVFTVFNSLQGLGIFVCHVLMTKKARDLVLKSINKTGSRFKGSRSTGSTRSGGHKTAWFQLSSSTTSSRTSESHSQTHQQSKQRSQQDGTESEGSAGQDCWTPRKFKFDFKVTNLTNRGNPTEKVLVTDGVSYRPRDGSKC